MAGGLVATLGMLQPDVAVLTQMGGAVGGGALIGLAIANRIKVGITQYNYSLCPL